MLGAKQMELSFKDFKEIIGKDASHPYQLGEKYIIRTVTMIYTGRLREIYATELVLEDAAWIADTGRWAEALSKGTLKEIEPYPEGRVIIGRGAILDVTEWKHALPRVTL